MGTLRIDLLGTSFSIEAKEDTAYLEKLLEYYERITLEVQDMASNADKRKIAILSGIMLCDELFKERTKTSELKKFLEDKQEPNLFDSQELFEVEKRTLKMINDLDRLLP